jgi:hypothetical protein
VKFSATGGSSGIYSLVVTIPATAGGEHYLLVIDSTGTATVPIPLNPKLQ